ncbi:MAG: hypothetical protein PHZ25_02735 [Candidatus Pacebacteria bacterium]|nr:hypothetical protein [Candidatus Paceibacterota bacterium]
MKEKKKNVLPDILIEAVRNKEKIRDREAGYGCHTETGYNDGYGDTQYGDYEDAV